MGVIDETLPENKISKAIVDCSFRVHKTLGPGLLENIYEHCLEHELKKQNLNVERQKAQSVNYDGLFFDLGYRLDLLVEDKIIVELKAVEKILPVHKAQMMTYLKLSQKNIGLLINFNVSLIKDGIQRIVL